MMSDYTITEVTNGVATVRAMTPDEVAQLDADRAEITAQEQAQAAKAAQRAAVLAALADAAGLHVDEVEAALT
jgi:hypothetical protein